MIDPQAIGNAICLLIVIGLAAYFVAPRKWR